MWQRRALVSRLVSSQHKPQKKKNKRKIPYTRTQHMLKVACRVAASLAAAAAAAAALPSQYFIWHLNQILLVFCCHSRRRLPRTTTATTTATLILPRLDTQTADEYLPTCSQTLFCTLAHTRTHTHTRSVIDLCLYLANLASESPAVNPWDASTRRMRNIRPGKHDTSCANNARQAECERQREREKHRK